VIDQYRRGWALRNIREAKADLEAAKKMSYMAPNLIIEAIKKARTAVYYSLGEPKIVEKVVNEVTRKNNVLDEPFLRCLLSIEETVNKIIQLQDIDGEKAIKQAEYLIQTATGIVEILTGTKF